MSLTSKHVINYNEIYEVAKDEQWINLLNRCTEDFIDATCCPRVPYPDLKCGFRSTSFIPNFTKCNCALGSCSECVIDKTLSIENCEILMINDAIIDLLEWKDAPRARVKSNGEINTQRELSRTKDSVSSVVDKN